MTNLNFSYHFYVEFKVAFCGKEFFSSNTLSTFRIAQCEAEAKGEALQIAYQGQCCVLEEPCPRAPNGTVCDSEGVTHPDVCHFDFAQCTSVRKHDRNLTMAYRGKTIFLCRNPANFIFHSKHFIINETFNSDIFQFT